MLSKEKRREGSRRRSRSYAGAAEGHQGSAVVNIQAGTSSVIRLAILCLVLNLAALRFSGEIPIDETADSTRRARLFGGRLRAHLRLSKSFCLTLFLQPFLT